MFLKHSNEQSKHLSSSLFFVSVKYIMSFIPALEYKLSKLKDVLEEVVSDMSLVATYYTQTKKNNDIIIAAFKNSSNVDNLLDNIKNNTQAQMAMEYDITTILNGNFTLTNVLNTSNTMKAPSSLGNIKLAPATGRSNLQFGLYSGNEIAFSNLGFVGIGVQNRGTCCLTVQNSALAAVPLQTQDRSFSYVFETIDNTSNQYYLVNPNGYVAWNPQTDVLTLSTSKSAPMVVKWSVNGTFPLGSHIKTSQQISNMWFQRYTTNFISSNALGVWDFFDATKISGNTVTNSLSESYPMTFTNAVKNDSSSYNFNGVSASASINLANAIIPSLSDTGSYTVSFWVNLKRQKNTSTAYVILEKASSQATKQSPFRIQILINQLQACVTNQTQVARAFVPIAPYENVWSHITVVYDNRVQNARVIIMYANGVEVARSPVTLTSISNTDNITILRNSATNSFTSGLLGHVSIHTTVLTPAQISQNFEATRPMFML